MEPEATTAALRRVISQARATAIAAAQIARDASKAMELITADGATGKQRIAIRILDTHTRRAVSSLGLAKRALVPATCDTTRRTASVPTAGCTCRRCAHQRHSRTDANLISRHPAIHAAPLATLRGEQ